jgi:phage portal protein BeeE
MTFGVRNPTSNIYGNGYGVSEIEILINTVTSMLWAEEYNRKFFSQGSAPKGFIKIKSDSGAGGEKISEFKRMWQAMMSGVSGSHKTPILQGDVDWIDLQKTNRDMEFTQWFEFLIKVACAIYRIDPAEVNFPLSGGAEQRAMFEGNNEARLKHSRDKGLRPLIKFYQRKLNKMVVRRLDPRYEMVFVGLENDDPNTDIERDTKMAGSFMTVDEIRIRRGLEPLGPEGGGDIIENAVWLQNKTQKAMMEQQQQQMQGAGGVENYYGNEEDPNVEQEPIEEEDPFGKALQTYWNSLRKSN